MCTGRGVAKCDSSHGKGSSLIKLWYFYPDSPKGKDVARWDPLHVSSPESWCECMPSFMSQGSMVCLEYYFVGIFSFTLPQEEMWLGSPILFLAKNHPWCNMCLVWFFGGKVDTHKHVKIMYKLLLALHTERKRSDWMEPSPCSFQCHVMCALAHFYMLFL